MKKILIGIVVLILGAGAWWWLGIPPFNQPAMAPTDTMNQTEETSEAVMGENTVEIKDFAYSPATLTVKVGDTVTWTNKDLAGHSATANDGLFDTGVLAQGESGSFTFTAAGTYQYHCTPHPNIIGTIIVE